MLQTQKSTKLHFKHLKLHRAYRVSGFTIVELLIVIVVIGILAAITLIAYNGVQDRAAAASLQSDLRQAGSQIELDKTFNGQWVP